MASSRRTTGSRSRWITWPEFAAIAWILAFAAAGPAPAAGDDRPQTAPAATAVMTNEAVVRMVAEHLPVDQILQTIRSARTTAFDLDPEIVIELRRAGVPDAVIEAMKQAQRAAPRPAAPGAEPAPGRGTLELVFDKEPGAVQRGTAVSIAKDWNDRPVSLAFFVICVDPLHAPDLWDTKTPLREAFPRHHLIWFLDRTLPMPGSRSGSAIFLDLPARATAEADEGAHALRVGVAARAGDDPWTEVASAGTPLTVAAGQASQLVIRVRTQKADRLSLALGSKPRITCTIVRVQPPAAGPDAAPPPP